MIDKNKPESRSDLPTPKRAFGHPFQDGLAALAERMAASEAKKNQEDVAWSQLRASQKDQLKAEPKRYRARA